MYTYTKIEILFSENTLTLFLLYAVAASPSEIRRNRAKVKAKEKRSAYNAAYHAQHKRKIKKRIELQLSENKELFGEIVSLF